MGKRYFSALVPPVPKHLDAYVHLKRFDDVAKNSGARRFLKKIPIGKTLAAGAGAGGLAYLKTQVDAYVRENSGCFLRSREGRVCKARELSCCQRERGREVEPCAGYAFPADACLGYDATKEKECCRLCDSGRSFLREGDVPTCRTPDAIEALSYFGKNVTSGFFDFLGSLAIVKAFVVGLAVIVFCVLLFRFI